MSVETQERRPAIAIKTQKYERTIVDHLDQLGLRDFMVE
jgi:hypothetical protein